MGTIPGKTESPGSERNHSAKPPEKKKKEEKLHPQPNYQPSGEKKRLEGLKKKEMKGGVWNQCR